MNVTLNKTGIAFGAASLLTGVFIAAYFSQPLLLLAPVGLIAILLLLQHPRFLFYALIASIPWSAEVNFSESLGTDLPDEPLMLLTAFAAVALWLYQKKKGERPAEFHPLLLLLFMSFCWTAITVAASTLPFYSIKYLAAKAWYLLAFVAAPLLLDGDKKLVRNAALVLFVFMFAVTLLALYRHAQLGFTFADVNEALQPHFRNHVNYSALLVMTAPLVVAFMAQTKNRALRFALVLSLFIIAVALYFSYSRGAWLAFAIGLSTFWLIRKGWLFKAFLTMCVLVMAAAFWLQHQNNYLRFAPEHNATVFHQNFSEHLAATYRGRDVSTAERFYRWAAGGQMAAQKPLTGFGPATFYNNYKSYTIPIFRTWVSGNKEKSTVHNYFLLLLVEQGVPGLLLFLLLVGAMFWYAQKIYRRTTDDFWKAAVAAVAAILFMQCAVNFLSDLIETDKVGSVFYLCAAVLVMADRRQKEEGRRQQVENRTEG